MTLNVFFGWVLLVVCTGGFFASMIVRLCRERRKSRRILKEWDTAPAQPPLIEQHVTVIEKQCYTSESGHKWPQHHRHFGVKVRQDNGKERWLRVDEEMYHTMEEHAVGTLALVGDRVYGFCPDSP